MLTATRIRYDTDTTLSMQSMASPGVIYSKSIFTAHQLHPHNTNAIKTAPLQPDWIMGLLLFCFVLLAWTQVFYHKRIVQVYRAPFSRRFINQLTRDGNLFKERISLTLGIVYILTFSLLLFEFNVQILGLEFHLFPGYALFWVITLANIAIMAVKVSLVELMGIIFKTRETTYNYLLNLLIFALLSAPLMLVVLVFVLYLKIHLLLYICLILYALLFLFRFVRGFFIGMTLTKFSYLFLFVYLCSLEILPLLVIIKILLNQAQSAGG
ncbi:MAG: DUF4271 domain-containing protein [Bacteroidota bacterium]